MPGTTLRASRPVRHHPADRGPVALGYRTTAKQRASSPRIRPLMGDFSAGTVSTLGTLRVPDELDQSDK